MIAGATLQTYSAAQTGSYTVLITDNNGCTAVSAVFDLINTGTELIPEEAAIVIIPNPNSGVFTIEVRNDKVQDQEGSIEIYNAIGQRVFFSQTPGLNQTIDISAQPAGSYFIRITGRRGKQIFRVIKT